MSNPPFNTAAELTVIPSSTSSKSDFDFLVGSYIVHHKKLKSRLTNCNEWLEFDGTHEMHKILNGTGNLETHYMTNPDGSHVEGIALRLFNPVTKLWSIYWANSNQGTFEAPVVGSFEKNIGRFFSKDIFKGKEISVQFLWDATDIANPSWSQAFSTDNGKTWEWNWYMGFTKNETKMKSIDASKTLPDQNNSNAIIKVIELRNYVLKPGLRDKFINYFENNFIQSQNELGANILGEYRVKGADDNFLWIRGFSDIQSRSKFLPSFYYGDFWKAHRTSANAMLANNDNVYLLKPLTLQNDTLVTDNGVNNNQFKKNKGIAVVDFYIANTKLCNLIELFSKSYLPLIKNAGIKDYSLWVSEMEENSFS